VLRAVNELFRQNVGPKETETIFQDASKLAKEEEKGKTCFVVSLFLLHKSFIGYYFQGTFLKQGHLTTCRQ